MAESRKLTIHFTDGTKLSFAFPPQTSDAADMARMIKEMLGQEQLSIEADGTLFIFPTSNIKYIQGYPSPPSLPDTVIQGARIID